MKNPLVIVIILFLLGSLFWKVFHAQWESSYIVQNERESRSYLMDIESSPLWSRPSNPTFDDFEAHFSEIELPDGGVITVYNRWDWWIIDFTMVLLVGFLILTPASFLSATRNKPLGVFARIGAGLIISALSCLLLWLVVGGWGPPAPLVFAVIGLFGGGMWAAIYSKKNLSEQVAAPDPSPSATSQADRAKDRF